MTVESPVALAPCEASLAESVHVALDGGRRRGFCSALPPDKIQSNHRPFRWRRICSAHAHVPHLSCVPGRDRPRRYAYVALANAPL